MKSSHHYNVPKDKFDDFLDKHKGEPMVISYQSPLQTYIVTIETDLSEPEFHMDALLDLRDSEEVTLEEKNAIDYSISAIKTLIDMGVLK